LSVSPDIAERAPARPLLVAPPAAEGPELEPRTGRLVAAVYDDDVFARTGLPTMLGKAGIRVVDAAPVDVRIADRGIVPNPDVAIVAGGDDGAELSRRLADEHGVAVLRLSPTPGEAADMLGVLTSGARGAVCRRCSAVRVLDAVQTVARGGRFFGCPHGAAESPHRSRVLSPRERRVTIELARGLSTEEIAETLVLSPHTIRTHIRNIQRKLGARTRAHAIAVAVSTHELDGLGQTA
jgi:two-component system invasion response regulator UvrY